MSGNVPGATIEFSIVAVDGEFHLRKVAHAVEAHAAVSAGVGAEKAERTWRKQAENLKDVVHKYGGSQN